MGRPERVFSLTAGLAAAAAARQPLSAVVCQFSSPSSAGARPAAPETMSTAETRCFGMGGDSEGTGGTVGSVTGAGTVDAGGGADTGGAGAGTVGAGGGADTGGAGTGTVDAAGGADTGGAGTAGGGAPALGQSLRTASRWTAARPVAFGVAGSTASLGVSVIGPNHEAWISRKIGISVVSSIAGGGGPGCGVAEGGARGGGTGGMYAGIGAAEAGATYGEAGGA
jgi:hypothetical protein